MSDDEIWDLWEVDDRAQHSCVIGDGGTRGDMLKKADVMNEGHSHAEGNCIRYIALPRGQEPEFSTSRVLPRPSVPAQAPPVTASDLLTHQWRCSLAASSPTAACSPARPHAYGLKCGYWFSLTLPSNMISDELVRLMSALLRTGTLTAAPPGRIPPVY